MRYNNSEIISKPNKAKATYQYTSDNASPNIRADIQAVAEVPPSLFIKNHCYKSTAEFVVLSGWIATQWLENVNSSAKAITKRASPLPFGSRGASIPKTTRAYN